MVDVSLSMLMGWKRGIDILHNIVVVLGAGDRRAKSSKVPSCEKATNVFLILIFSWRRVGRT